ncbi:chemotaxis protein CheB [Enterovibrio calviensis]|uniref:chemotaxis protein CheB n=1 Tax=Enterovibrio calviensis TaxID=91359 RepID=UPI0004846D60|nr:chemotaxis protein CheB [Enterovibrio calviensis]
MNEVQVRSGEFQFAYRKPIWLHTVVGTCVVVCIWDQENQSGGMCHYRLPIAPNAIAMGELVNDYGNCAIPNLLKKFKHTSSNPKNLMAWVIGGGQVHDGEFMQSQQIGERNVLVALETLAHYGLPIVGTSVGGGSGRQIRFNPKFGEVDFRFVDEATSGTENTEVKLSPNLKWVYAISESDNFKASVEQALCHDPSVHVQAVHDIESIGHCFAHQAPQVLIIDSEYLSSAPLPMISSSSALFQSSMRDEASQSFRLPTVVVAHEVTPLIGTHYRTLAQTVGNRILVSTPQHLERVLASAIGLNALSVPLHTQAVTSSLNQPLEKEGGEPDGVVLIGSSTGGVDALEVLLSQLPGKMPAICIAQHIPEGYSSALVQRLNTKSQLTVKEAVDGEVLARSHVYFAPGNHHIKLVQLGDGQVVVRATQDPPINSFRPSVDYLFDSATKINDWRIVAALFTGMGSDGAKGLHRLKHHGAFTLVQDEKSCVVYGMGRVAKELGAVCRTVSIQEMAGAILDAYLSPASDLPRGGQDQFSKELR